MDNKEHDPSHLRAWPKALDIVENSAREQIDATIDIKDGALIIKKKA